MDVAGRYRVGTRAREQGEVIEAPAIGPYAVAAFSPERSSVLYQLFVLNIVLQIFDGIATYNGLQFGIREGNPLLRDAFHLWGVGSTLLVFKANACALLLSVYRFAGAHLALPALSLLAAVYSVCSLIPWLAMLLRLLPCFL